MATRRFRIKAVANVSVSRGRCGEKPQKNEKLDEKTWSTSTASDSQDALSRQTTLVASAGDTTLVAKVSEDTSLNETLENSPVRHLVQNTENVSKPTRLEASVCDRSTPLDTRIVVDCNLTQHPAYTDVQQSCNSDREQISVCNRGGEGFTVSTDEHCFKTEERDCARSGDSSGTGPQKIDTTETKMPSAPIRLPRKRMKPTVSLSLINRKAKETPTVEIAQQCGSLNETSEHASPHLLPKNSVDASEWTSLEGKKSDLSTAVDTLNIGDCQLAQHPEYADVQNSGNCANKVVSLCNKTDEEITVSTAEYCFETKEGVDSMRFADSCATTAEKIDTTETKILAVPIVENAQLHPTVQKSANVSEPSCLEENGSGCFNSVNTQSVVNCNSTEHPGRADVQQSDNCNNKDESLCNRADEDITVSADEQCSKTEIDSVRLGDFCATSSEKIDTTETKISAALRLPRKRVKPTVSLSLVNKKAKESSTVDDAQFHPEVQNSVSVSEPMCLEENKNCRPTPVNSQSVVNCNLTQHPGYADVQQSDNCNNKDESLCNRTNEDITSSASEHGSKTEIDSVRLGDLCSTSSEKSDTTETKISATPLRLTRKRMKPTVSLSLVNKKLKENPTVENTQFHPAVHNSANASESTCLEENDSGRSTPVSTQSVVNCNLIQHPGHADAQQSYSCNNRAESLCNRANEDITASTGEHCSKTEIDSVRLGDSCATSSEKSDATETKTSATPIRLPRKHMKPTVSLSLVNKKAKENPTEQLTQQCSASKIDDNSTVKGLKKLQNREASSDLGKDVDASDSVRAVPADGNETQNCNVLREVQKRHDPEIVPQISEEAHVLQSTVHVPGRKDEIPPDVISLDTSVGERCSGTVNVSTPICETPVVIDSPAVGKDVGTSPPVKCPVNQSVKDCTQLNSFRSRFVRPKPLLDLAARRNRTGSVGSASESDSEKKSLSSATTVSPPWQPRLKTSRTRLTHVQTMETDKVANASSASTDESEDERSSISRAVTISPPKKITRLDSYSGSDTSHSEFSQDVSEESSSPVKKPYTKPERVTKRKEYLRRIIEIKKEISHKVSDGKVNKSRLTMFDLIYYNPVTNPMKSVQESDGKKSAPAPTNATENENRLAEESVDEPEALEDEERSTTVPVPQVKVGPNGEIILDEQSLVIETTDAKKNWNDLQNSEVIMDYGTGTTTFNAYSKKRKSRTKDWNREETLRFYRALHTVGTDFLVMQSLFPKFTRKELKDRYKKEERVNRELVEKALRNPLTFDLTELQKEFEVERLEEERRLAQPKKIERRKRGFRRTCSLFAVLDSTDTGEVRYEGKNLKKLKTEEKAVKRKCDTLKDLEETHSKKERKADNIRVPSKCTPDSEKTHSKKKRKADYARTHSECTPDSKKPHSKKKRKADDTMTPSECTLDSEETHSKKKKKKKAVATRAPSEYTAGSEETHRKKKKKTVATRAPPECTAGSEETCHKKKKKAVATSAPSECTAGSDASNAPNGHVDSENSVPEANSQVKPTRSGRIPRPRIFEDFMTDDVEEIYEETEITEICDRVTVEDVCDSEPVEESNQSEHEELEASENVLVDEDTSASYESENDDQNFVIAEDALTVNQSQVNLGSVYSNVKPGTLIVLATESPDNPGHQIFRVFMVSNNSQTLPVSVTNNQASPPGTNNSVEMGTSTDTVLSENSTNDCNSQQMSAESSS